MASTEQAKVQGPYALLLLADGTLLVICPTGDEQQDIFKAINQNEVVVKVKA